jgi:quercetin dioxygenase-like cupin family protein
MRTRTAFRIRFVSALLLALALLPMPALHAQDASPMAGGPIAAVELAPGVTAEILAGVPSDRAPDQTLYSARFTFQSGAEIFPHSHPGTVSLTVVEGTLGWTLLEGTAHIIWGSASGNPTGMEDVTEPNVEVTLEVGDAIFYEDDVVHTARGAGDGETVVLASLLLESGQPLLMPMDMDMSTPAS